MKRADLYDLKPARKEVIDLRGDVRREVLPENVCCMRLKELENRRLNIPDIGMFLAAVNYCFICGRKLG